MEILVSILVLFIPFYAIALILGGLNGVGRLNAMIARLLAEAFAWVFGTLIRAIVLLIFTLFDLSITSALAAYHAANPLTATRVTDDYAGFSLRLNDRVARLLTR